MGRGISDLQKSVLRIAYRNRVREFCLPECEPGVKPPCEALRTEVLIEHFGFAQIGKGSPRRRADGWGWPWHGQWIRKSAVGHRRYVSAHASLSRSTLRLVRRGLITEDPWGYNLTDEGVRLCAAMFPEEADQVPTGGKRSSSIRTE